MRKVRLTPQQYFLVASVAMGTLVLIVFTGAAVRVTGSGLGCPDWPNCYEDGRLTPELGTHSYIEFGNRMLTSIVGISAVAAFVLAFAGGGVVGIGEGIVLEPVVAHRLLSR